MWLTIVNVILMLCCVISKIFTSQDNFGKQQLYFLGDSCGIYAGQTKTDHKEECNKDHSEIFIQLLYHVISCVLLFLYLNLL